MTIVIGKKTERSGYFEIEYTFTLDVPQAQQASMTKQTTALNAKVSDTTPAVNNSTVTVTGVAGYTDGTSIDDIKADLQARLQSAQDNLNNDDSLIYAGMNFDGTNWN